MSTAQAPASIAEAMTMILAGLSFLAAADPTALAAQAQAECLQTLEQADAMSTAARARILAAFTAGQTSMRLSCQAALGSFSWVAGKAVASSYSQPVVRQCQMQPSRRPNRLRWAAACRSPSSRRRS